jgi:hypothetical protein
VLGEETAFAFVQYAFKTATEGLLARQSDSLIRDRIRAELLNHLNTAESRLLEIAVDHAGLIFEIAAAFRDRVFESPGGKPQTLAKRARHRWVPSRVGWVCVFSFMGSRNDITATKALSDSYANMRPSFGGSLASCSRWNISDQL